jgi:choline dehydrogenase-like flavoprotein
MELDHTQGVSPGTIETDVCIIGAGPAGSVVASELIARGRNVVVLESGAAAGDARAQSLNAGEMTGDPYAGLQATRHRGVGGTALLWNTPAAGGPGAKYLPLDPWDLEGRWPEAADGWALGYAELCHWYRRAQTVCGLGPFAYDGSDWSSSGSSGGDSGAAAPPWGPPLTTRVYQFGSREALLAPRLAALRASPSARLVRNATVLQLTDEGGAVRVAFAGPSAARGEVRARRVVLAAGAVENARLLLVSRAAGAVPPDRSGWLGCGFMEHPRDRTLSFVPARRGWGGPLAFLDQHTAPDGTMIAGRLALDGGFVRRHGTLNASATILPIVRTPLERLRRLVGPAARLPVVRDWLPAGGTGWSRHPIPQHAFAGFVVLLNVEQPPRRENAITLGARRDPFGVPVAALHWRWHPDDHARLATLRTHIASAMEQSGLGRVTIGPDRAPDPNAHHHAGTTRAHPDPRHGVVDTDGRLHGSETIFVTGASTFPTAGFANPMLTLVALALRLGEHLGSEGQARPGAPGVDGGRSFGCRRQPNAPSG